jgi:hypothetical protein
VIVSAPAEVWKTASMGLFSRKVRSDALRRKPPAEEVPWFAAEPDDEELALQIEANRGAMFDAADEAWLRHDPGAEIRARRSRDT